MSKQEFCFVKNNEVVNVIVCDEPYAEEYCEKNKYDSFFERTKEKKEGIGFKYHTDTKKYVNLNEVESDNNGKAILNTEGKPVFKYK